MRGGIDPDPFNNVATKLNIRDIKYGSWFTNPVVYLSIVLASLLSAGIIYIIYHQIYFVELCSGLAVAVVNAVAANCINQKAIRSNRSLPLFWGLGANGIRIGFLIVIILFVNSLQIGKFTPFLLALMIGYFCLMFSEILSLHINNIGDRKLADL